MPSSRGWRISRAGRIRRWASERGLREIAVRSNVVRAESHPFYEGRGYARVKTQHVYLKPLT